MQSELLKFPLVSIRCAPFRCPRCRRPFFGGLEYEDHVPRCGGQPQWIDLDEYEAMKRIRAAEKRDAKARGQVIKLGTGHSDAEDEQPVLSRRDKAKDPELLWGEQEQKDRSTAKRAQRVRKRPIAYVSCL